MNVSSFFGFINPLWCLFLQVLITPSLHRRQTDKIINECKVPKTSTHKRKKREKKRASHKETGGGYKREREGGVSASQSQLYVRTSTTVCSQTHTLQLSGTKKKKTSPNLEFTGRNGKRARGPRAEPGTPTHSHAPMRSSMSPTKRNLPVPFPVPVRNNSPHVHGCSSPPPPAPVAADFQLSDVKHLKLVKHPKLDPCSLRRKATRQNAPHRIVFSAVAGRLLCVPTPTRHYIAAVSVRSRKASRGVRGAGGGVRPAHPVASIQKYTPATS